MLGESILRRTAQRLTVAAIALHAGSAAFAGDGVYQEQGGLLVVEFESTDAGGQWKHEKLVPGHTGTGYIRWDGPDHFGSPGHDPFAVDFDIYDGGIYAFRIRNHHDHPDSTEENDVWVRLDGGPWVKTFSGVKDQWTWATNHEFHDDKPPAEYDLSPGRHRIEFSGRSHNFRMDRFHLYRLGHPHGQDPSQPESPCDVENRPPVARVRVTPDSVSPDDMGQTTFTLDASGSFDPDSEQSLSFRWRVPRVEYVEGTGPSSPVAKVRLSYTRFAIPVRLTVTDDAEEPLSDRAYEIVNLLGEEGELSGEPVAWHPLQISFHGPTTDENGVGPHTFLDYRLNVTFTGPSGSRYVVPGFYDGDGHGLGSGNVWSARFSPDEGGLWRWEASFRSGPNVAIDLAPDAGHPIGFDGATGEVVVFDRDLDAEGFLSKGRLEHVGGHYLKFRDGGYFLKGGTDSPENFLGYAGFDDVQDNGGIGIIHRYEPHVNDWRPGDPYFVSNLTGVTSKGIVGALNYLSSVGVNSIYFLPMNLGGDGQETCPFVGYSQSNFDKTHYDVSRLYQWNQLLDHAQRKGIMLHFVLAETESGNENWLDDGELGVQRKLFFRELIARFGHGLAIKWNLSEENDFTIPQLKAFATYIRAVDPYDHQIGVHTHPNNFKDYPDLLGDPTFTSTSIQYSPDYAGAFVEEWRRKSKDSGHKWSIELDENGPASEGLTDENAEELRRRILYDIYFSGGQVEWYAGYHSLPLGGDVKMEDFRTRSEMWGYMRIAREFMERELPFWEMEPADPAPDGREPALRRRRGVRQGRRGVRHLPPERRGGRQDRPERDGREVRRPLVRPAHGPLRGRAQAPHGRQALAARDGAQRARRGLGVPHPPRRTELIQCGAARRPAGRPDQRPAAGAVGVVAPEPGPW